MADDPLEHVRKIKEGIAAKRQYNQNLRNDFGNFDARDLAEYISQNPEDNRAKEYLSLGTPNFQKQVYVEMRKLME